ncbi:hypothetical protein K8Z49_01195 [Actinomadura madurae]|uniref:hypothetical protein n=1 Tax=Actinomadura madurae TaxID=1993 RepID=UPI003999B6C8
MPLRGPEEIVKDHMARHEAVMGAESVPDLFERLNAAGTVLRISADDRPTAFRCATVSLAELEQLRRIEHVVRLGRVKRITETDIELDGGTVPTGHRALHVDCTADAIKQRPIVPIFQDGLIIPQSVRVCQPVFSAALIAHVETAYGDDAQKNALCPVSQNPRTDTDWLRFAISGNLEQLRWAGNADLGHWLNTSRLQPNMTPPMPQDPAARAAYEQQAMALAEAQTAKLEELLRAHAARAGTGDTA